MLVQTFLDCLGAGFFTGVPDSQLKALCNYLVRTYGTNGKHMIAANEGNCVALAAGYHLATGDVPLVYMQNSGEGNAINPMASLLNRDVYGIPMIFVIGWRGEPGVKDEPQHIFQGKVTLSVLDTMEIPYMVLSRETTVEELQNTMSGFKEILASGGNVAFVVRKGALEDSGKTVYSNPFGLIREEVIEEITRITGNDPIVCTTGKASRELFEVRARHSEDHSRDFLTVGSMGHASSIALGIALQKKDQRIWCIDGDGAALMHMGAMAVIGAKQPKNFVHIVLDNQAHETVGGMPTVSGAVSFTGIAKACGYEYTADIEDETALRIELEKAKEQKELTFLCVHCALGSREDLGRPTTSAQDNKASFMAHLREL